RIADQAGEIGEHRDALLYLGRRGDGGMLRRRADRHRIARDGDAVQLLDTAEVDHVRRRGEAQLQGRQQGLATGDELAVAGAAQQLRGFVQRGGLVIVECVHVGRLRPYYSAAAARFWRWIICQTFCGVAGMSMSSVPSASVMAFMRAAGAAIAPASPPPFTPSGLCGQGVSVIPTL